MRLSEILKHDVELEREIHSWLMQLHAPNLKAYSWDNGVLNCDDDATLDGGHHLKYKFGTVQETFFLTNFTISDITNFPARVGASIVLHDCRGLTSLKGIHQVVKQLGFNRMSGRGVFEINHTTIKEAVLGLLLIKGLGMVRCFGDPTLETVATILNKHVGKGRAGVIAAQQELLDAGLDDYAKL